VKCLSITLEGSFSNQMSTSSSKEAFARSAADEESTVDIRPMAPRI